MPARRSSRWSYVSYRSVGFGGGSTYTALLALGGVDYRLLPLLSLACNIVVVAGSTLRFARARITPWRDALLLTAGKDNAAAAALLAYLRGEPARAIIRAHGYGL